MLVDFAPLCGATYLLCMPHKHGLQVHSLSKQVDSCTAKLTTFLKQHQKLSKRSQKANEGFGLADFIMLSHIKMST